MSLRMELLSSLLSLTRRGTGWEEEKIALGERVTCRGDVQLTGGLLAQERCALRVTVIGCKKGVWPGGSCERKEGRGRYGIGE